MASTNDPSNTGSSTSGQNKDAKADANNIAADVEQLKADIRKLSDTLVSLGRERLDTARREGSERLSAGRDELEEMAADLRRRGQHELNAVEGQVRERPILALLAAFGIGIIVSRLIERR